MKRLRQENPKKLSPCAIPLPGSKRVRTLPEEEENHSRDTHEQAKASGLTVSASDPSDRTSLVSLIFNKRNDSKRKRDYTLPSITTTTTTTTTTISTTVLPPTKRARTLIDNNTGSVDQRNKQFDESSIYETSRIASPEKEEEEDEEQEEKVEREKSKEKVDDSIDSLLAAFSTVSVSKQKYGYTLQDAARDGKIETVKKLLEQHYTEVKEYLGWAFGYAAENGHFDIVKYILETKKDDLIPGQIRWGLGKTTDNRHRSIADFIKEFLPQEKSCRP